MLSEPHFLGSTACILMHVNCYELAICQLLLFDDELVLNC